MVRIGLLENIKNLIFGDFLCGITEKGGERLEKMVIIFMVVYVFLTRLYSFPPPSSLELSPLGLNSREEGGWGRLEGFALPWMALYLPSKASVPGFRYYLCSPTPKAALNRK